MTDNIYARQELLMMVGQPVHVRATLSRLGTLPGREDRADYATALLNDIELIGSNAQIHHAWIRLGTTGSTRARKYNLKNCRVELDAIVIAYRAGEHLSELRLGLGDVTNFIAYVGGRWRTIARRREVVDTDVGERISQGYVDEMLAQLLWSNQLPVMEQAQRLANSQRIDRATNRALERFFVRKSPVSPGQLRHIDSLLEATREASQLV